MTKLRIAHLVSLATVGGVERFFTSFAIGSGENFEHHVFLASDDVHEFFEKSLTNANVKLHSLRKVGGIYIPKHPKFLRNLLHKYLIRKTNVQALLIWNKLEDFPMAFPEELRLIHFERGSAWLAKGKESVRLHLSKCTAILANSQAGMKLLKGRWGLPDNIPTRVCNNGINPYFLEQAAPVKQKEAIVRLGFAGRFVPLKGWILALMTLKELLARNPSGYKLIIGGEGRQLDIFKKLVKDWGLEASVDYVGLVKDMRTFFSQIDIFLHTSLREPFGNVAVEAQALGCPVVAGIVDGNTEIIKHNVSGILIPMDIDVETLKILDASFLELPEFVWDPEKEVLRKPCLMSVAKMADAVEVISLSNESLSEYSKNAANWVRNEFDFNLRCKALENTLKEILT